MNRDTDYHNRLEQEVTQLRQENANWQIMNLTFGAEKDRLEMNLHISHAEIARLRLDNEQLRQAIAVLNDEPTNSL
jgi:cell division protein FtsB